MVLYFFGAGDEARTRYLHLGKVALYRMSYTRGTSGIITDFRQMSIPKMKFYHLFYKLFFAHFLTITPIASECARSNIHADLFLLGILFLQECASRGNVSAAVSACVCDSAFLQDQHLLERGFLLQAHNRDANGISGRLGSQERCRDHHCATVSRIERDLGIRIHSHSTNQGALVGEGTGKASAVCFGLIGVQRHFSGLSVFKKEQYKALIIARQNHLQDLFLRVHTKLLRQIITKQGRLAIIKIRQAALVALELICKDQDLCLIIGLF